MRPFLLLFAAVVVVLTGCLVPSPHCGKSCGFFRVPCDGPPRPVCPQGCADCGHVYTDGSHPPIMVEESYGMASAPGPHDGKRSYFERRRDYQMRTGRPVP